MAKTNGYEVRRDGHNLVKRKLMLEVSAWGSESEEGQSRHGGNELMEM